MAKYRVLMSCGHEDTVNIFGRTHERESKIRYYEENGLCKDCYKKWRQKKNEETGLLFHAEILREIDEEDGSLLVEVWLTDNTAPYKDQIKSLGYTWTTRNWVNDWCWLKTIKFENLSNEMKQAEEMGAIIVEDFEKLIGNGNYALALKLQKKRKKLFDEIAKLDKPEVPEILQEFRKHKWNGTIYGKSGSYAVYLDGEKMAVPDEEVKEINRYYVKRDKYNQSKEEIKKAYEMQYER